MATIKLIRVKCKNLTTKEDLWRLGVKSIGNVSAEDFVRHAAEHCDVKVGTLRAAMAAFVDSAKLFLSMGHGVQLGDLGTLQLSVTSKATKLEKDLTAKNLTGVNVNLRPIGDLAKEIKNFKFSVAGAVNEEEDDNTGTIDPGTGSEPSNAGGGNSNNAGNQQTGGLTPEPEKYRITFKFSDDTEDDHEYAEGETINYPTPTSGYKWPDSKPTVMPNRNVTVTEVAIAQGGGTGNTGGETYTATIHVGEMYVTRTGAAGSALDLPQLESGYSWPSNMPTVMPAMDFTAYAIEGEQDTSTEYTLTVQHNGETLRTEQLHADDIVFLGTAPDGYKWTNTPRYSKMPARDWTVSTQAV